MLLTVLAAPASAGAQDGAIVLVHPDEALEHAVRVALRPWGTVVRTVAVDASTPPDSTTPGATMPGSATRARALAREHDALAVVWVSHADGYALWVYDRRHERALVRALPSGPPFDGPTAAQVALMIKTLLRHSPVSPPDEAEPRAPERPALVWLEVLGGARAFSTAPAAVEARFGLAVAWWPAELDEHLAVGLRVVSGPGVSVETSAWSGHWTDTALALSLTGRLAVAPVDFAATALVGAHLSTLDGRLALGGSTTELRVDPIVGAEAELGVRLDRRVRLALSIGSTVPLTTQVYLVGTERALEVERIHLAASLRLGVALP